MFQSRNSSQHDFVTSPLLMPHVRFCIPPSKQTVVAYAVGGPPGAKSLCGKDFHFSTHAGIAVCVLGCFPHLTAAEKHFKLREKSRGSHHFRGTGSWPYAEPFYANLDDTFCVGMLREGADAIRDRLLSLAPETSDAKARWQAEVSDAKARLRATNEKRLNAAGKLALWDDVEEQDPTDATNAPHLALAEHFDTKGHAAPWFKVRREVRNPSQSHVVLSLFFDPGDTATLKQRWFVRVYGATKSEKHAHAFLSDCVMRRRRDEGLNIALEMYQQVPLDLTNTAKFFDPSIVRAVEEIKDKQEIANAAWTAQTDADSWNEVLAKSGASRRGDDEQQQTSGGGGGSKQDKAGNDGRGNSEQQHSTADNNGGGGGGSKDDGDSHSEGMAFQLQQLQQPVLTRQQTACGGQSMMM